MLKIKKLGKSFDGVRAVHKCDFTVEENKIVALIGPNGAGKTTIFNLISGMIRPDKGQINFKENSIVGIPSYKISQLGIARTFQLIRLFPKLTVMENLLIAKPSKGETLTNTLLKSKQAEKEETTNKKKCLKLLKLVGLSAKRNSLAKNLSYGQQKLLEIARALATEADLLLLDEPVAGVNPVMRKQIKNILLKLKKDDKTILFIEHDMKFVMGLADKVVVMDHGEEIAIGTPNQIKRNKKVREAYLGKKIKL